MRLWNEYEGTTIAGIFPVDKLIRPEGRSAFFSTTNGTGTPAVLRLIESINDEAEILTRWKTVAGLKDAHLITLKKFGQTIFEDTPLIYVLMEPSEGDLAGILQERALTVEETRQIATSLVDALEALHASDIVHEHVEPSNVMATAGDVVKLRSDCVREAPEGDEGIALKKQDVHDLAVVLLQSLTRKKSLSDLGATKLPAPFDPIIRNGINGSWGLAQIAAALTPVAPPATFERAPALPNQSRQMPLAIPQPTAAPAASAPASALAQSGKATATVPGPATARPQGAPAVSPSNLTRPQAAAPTIPKAASADLKATPLVPAAHVATPHQERITVPVEDDPSRRRLWMAIAPVVIVIAAALGWHALHRPGPTGSGPQPVTTLAEVGQPAGSPAAAPNASSTAPAAAAPASDTPSAAVAPADASHPWRVVAYTYNRRDQAQHKADTLAQRDAGLRPEVFTSSGRGPYLVTLGGAMTRDEAVNFRQKAQSEGLPRDIYIQNYESRDQRRARRR